MKKNKLLSLILKFTFISLATLVFVLLLYKQPFPEIEDSINGWEISTSYRISPNKSIKIENDIYKVNDGDNHVLIVTRQKKPIYVPGQPKLSDMNSSSSLIIELNQMDTFVSPNHLGLSKIYRENINLSPDYGVKVIEKNEKLEAKKLRNNEWAIDSKLVDFHFRGVFSFKDSSIVTHIYIDKQ